MKVPFSHWFHRAPPSSTASRDRDQESLSRWLAFLYLVPLAGVVGILIYAATGNATGRIIGVSLLWGASTWVFGGFLGFLFAIPQSATRNANAALPPGAYRSNSNLEEISDWLTKILVGIGLVQLGHLTNSLHRLINYISPSLDRGAGSEGYALALIVLFSTSGFLSVYIITRTNISVLFAQTEKRLQETVSVLASEAAATASQKDAKTEGIAPDAEPIDAAMSAAANVVVVDPDAAATLAGAQIVQTIQTLYSLIYAQPLTNIDSAIDQLADDGYLDSELKGIARQLLGLTRDSSKIGAFTPGAAANVTDATTKFLRSVGRTASLNFERKVQAALEASPKIKTVQSRPVAENGKQADFLATTSDDHKILVESYLPPRPQPKYLIRRIDDRIKITEAFGAASLIVVLPDGIPAEVTGIPPTANVVVTTISKLEEAIPTD